MDHAEIVSQVVRLLGLLPAVEVTGVNDQSAATTRIYLAVRSDESLARLCTITYAANVGISVHLEGWLTPSPTEPQRPELVRYELRVPKETDPFEPPGCIGHLGAYLVRHLRVLGQLQADNADSFLREWNFIVS